MCQIDGLLLSPSSYKSGKMVNFKQPIVLPDYLHDSLTLRDPHSVQVRVLGARHQPSSIQFADHLDAQNVAVLVKAY
jgi:hypothetical protein